jgi:hypothetical protein
MLIVLSSTDEACGISEIGAAKQVLVMLIVLSSTDEGPAFLANFVGFRLSSGFIHLLDSLNATVVPVDAQRGPNCSPEWIEALRSRRKPDSVDRQDSELFMNGSTKLLCP